ncbi:unnamed protein product [Prorocentrum cordatum]|uniref:Uncharacterized protein n=1 Tax=Prorocentrum cordatum TaxID=2364126 RepID=A0ABN9V1F8_9DINO|nr:unnamed protein product [Polarella glacialis]
MVRSRQFTLAPVSAAGGLVGLGRPLVDHGAEELPFDLSLYAVAGRLFDALAVIVERHHLLRLIRKLCAVADVGTRESIAWRGSAVVSLRSGEASSHPLSRQSGVLSLL